MRTLIDLRTGLPLVLVALASGSAGCDRSYDFPPFAAADATAPDVEPGTDVTTVDAPPSDSPDTTPSTDVAVPPADARDAPPACSDTPCRLIRPQCGCATGEGCVLDIMAPAGVERGVCITTGTVPEGGFCSARPDCVAGTDCYTGLCRRFCRQSGTDCPAGQVCESVSAPGASMGTTTYGVCTGEVCVPATGAGCPASLNCDILVHTDPSGGMARTVSYCTDAGTVPFSGACSSTRLCAPTFTCLVSGTGHACGRFCRVTMGNADCADAPARNGYPVCRTLGLRFNGLEYGACQGS
jgi:hypothetical protein